MDAIELEKRLKATTKADIHALSVELLEQHPEAKRTLDRLEALREERGGYGAFAPVRHGRCNCCNVTVATARLQQVKSREFINCANCMRFLYIEP